MTEINAMEKRRVVMKPKLIIGLKNFNPIAMYYLQYIKFEKYQIFHLIFIIAFPVLYITDSL